jgi:hypothetical protein
VNEKLVNFRVTEREFLILTRYAVATGRSKTEILREFVRSLEPMAREAKAKKLKAAKG